MNTIEQSYDLHINGDAWINCTDRKSHHKIFIYNELFNICIADTVVKLATVN